MGFLEFQAVHEASEEFWIISHGYSWLPREGELPLAKSGAIPKDFQREVTVGDGRDGR